MATAERPPAGLGCLSLLIGVVVLAAIVVVVFFAGIIALAIVAALLVLGRLVFVMDRMVLAVSPRRRERRAGQGTAFDWRLSQGPPGEVIDTTAVDSTDGHGDPRPEGGGTEEAGPA